MSVTVRAAEVDDAEAVQRLGRAAWHAAYDDVFGSDRVDRVVDQWWGVESLRGAAVAEERRFLVAERTGAGTGDDGRGIVGVVDVGPSGDRDGTYTIGRLYVHPDHWGEAIGTRLVDRVRERLPDTAERLRLVVLAENPVGVPFYESYGFERVEERTGETDGVEHEEYVYELSLAPQD